MAVTGGSYGGIMSWMALSMDLSDVSWRWRTGIVSTFVNPGDGCLYPNFLNGDDETRFSVRDGYSANTWLNTADCRPPYSPTGRLLRAEGIDPESGTIDVQFDDKLRTDDPRVVGQSFAFRKAELQTSRSPQFCFCTGPPFSLYRTKFERSLFIPRKDALSRLGGIDYGRQRPHSHRQRRCFGSRVV